MLLYPKLVYLASLDGFDLTSIEKNKTGQSRAPR